MQWLNKIVDEIIVRHPNGEIIVESGVSPSGTYHVGTLREILTADAIMQEIRKKGRNSKHIHFVDDLDVFRKVPAKVPADFERYLGRPLCDVPAPDGSKQSYADFFLNDFLKAAKALNLDMEVMRAHEKYRSGFMVDAIEAILANIEKVREVIAEVSGRKLEENWAPIQILEDEYLKNRQFVSIDKNKKTLVYLDSDGKEQTVNYEGGKVKLNWRVDWPARWWLLGVYVEPFGRDHATKGGSYDTGAKIIEDVFRQAPPIPVPYNFINQTGETKKMSKSAGDSIAMSELTTVLPSEVVRFFTLRYPPAKQLFFDQVHGVTKLIDDFARLLASESKTPDDQHLIDICTGQSASVISSIPFSHLVTAFQASLKNPQVALKVLSRTEHSNAVKKESDVIEKELKFIDQWLMKWAPEDIKFELVENVNPDDFSNEEKTFLAALSGKISSAPANADGEWFHKAIYEFKDSKNLNPSELFAPLYRALIGKEQGPRAGWFLSILPRDWLVKRLRLENASLSK